MQVTPALRPDYHRATRQAYRTLLAAKIDRLPVDVEAICERCHDTTLLSFRQAREMMGCDFDPFFDGPSREAILSRTWRDGRPYHIITWNDEALDAHTGPWRFAIAHEIGHIILRHVGGCHPAQEAEASLFAQHLLCPRPVLDVVQPQDCREIMYLCGVSQSAARIVFSTLRRENRYVDGDMWNGIFSAFGLDEKRNLSDHLSGVASVALAVARRRMAQKAL